MPQVVVIGAGVIGLSAALRVQAEGHEVVIVARDFPGPFETIDPKSQINYTSPWGGAHHRVVPPSNSAEEKEHAMSLKTYKTMEALHRAHPEAGITFMKAKEYLEAPSDAYLSINEEKAKALAYEEFKLLRGSELPDNVQWGCEYKTWCVNAMVYCSFLLRRFVYRGGKIVKKDIRTPLEVFAWKELGQVDAVINASGIGFNDPKVFPTRGQTCLVANYCPETITRQNADGSWTFSVPRNFEGGTVIGGTKEPNNWDSEPSLEARENLLSSFAATYPDILGKDGKFHVLHDIVGRRPTREGGMRLERESLKDGKTLLHAYGVGGRGYELSWGVAERVLELLKESTLTRSRL